MSTAPSPPSPPQKSSPPPTAAPSPSTDSPPSSNSSSPAPSSSNVTSPPPTPSNSHGAAPPSPPRIPSPPSHSGSEDVSWSPPIYARRGGYNATVEIVFAAVGAAALLVLLVVACLCCSRRTAPRRRKKPHNPMHFYADTSGYKGNSSYSTSGSQPQWPGESGAASSTSALGPAGGAWHVHPGDMTSGVHSGQRHAPPPPHEALGLGKGTFTYEELAAATGNFSQANLLGQGGFGYVHKGVLPGGKEVAVKQLQSGSGQGEREFQAEVDIISRVHHRHLVSLVGYCIAGARRMLVYDFVPNKTLEFHLHGQSLSLSLPCHCCFKTIIVASEQELTWLVSSDPPVAGKGLPVMPWPTRLRIALGAAKGLAYLHEDCDPRIIHRDIKSANILLDSNFEAMVADFGLAKLTSDDDTHVSTRVMGTFGYLAPEYASSGKLTEKSDVFSYGVMLLELVTGRRPIDNTHSFVEDSLVEWARPALARALADGDYAGVADPRLEGSYDPVEMARVAASAAMSVRHSAKKRPKMSQIVRALEGDMSLEDLNEGVRPGKSMLFDTAALESNLSEAPRPYPSDMNWIRQAATARD
ncbi:hypothetical protein ABZP36_006599 [Zizania latifolia]